jgi:hypothetical protein
MKRFRLPALAALVIPAVAGFARQDQGPVILPPPNCVLPVQPTASPGSGTVEGGPAAAVGVEPKSVAPTKTAAAPKNVASAETASAKRQVAKKPASTTAAMTAKPAAQPKKTSKVAAAPVAAAPAKSAAPPPSKPAPKKVASKKSTKPAVSNSTANAVKKAKLAKKPKATPKKT